MATAVDGAGDVYVTGESSNLTTTPGAFETTGTGAFVAKLSPTGTVLYATYLGDGTGGATNQYSGTGIAVDRAGDAFVIGGNLNVPTTPNAIAASAPGYVFVAELNPTGSSLVYSTYLPGALIEADNNPALGYNGAIAVDGSGNIYVAGSAQAGLPVTAGAFQTACLAPTFYNAYFAKIDPALSGSASLLYATYLGGTRQDAATAIVVDASGKAYLTGYTSSTNFPTTGGAFQRTFGGHRNAFVAKFDPALSGPASLVYSTYLGGNGLDGYYSCNGGVAAQTDGGIAVDSAGNAYVTGATTSTNFPTTAGAFQVQGGFPKKDTGAGGTDPADVFVTKLNATGTALVYSTYLGGGFTTLVSRSAGSSIALDSSGDAYLTGWTNSTVFPTKNAFQTTNTAPPSGNAGFVTELNPAGSSLVFSSYYGGSSTARTDGFGIGLDAVGNAYVGGAYTGYATAFVLKVAPVAADGSFSVTGFASATTAGVAGSFTVTALNANGSVNTAYTGTVHFTSSDPQAVLPADLQLVNGTATLSVTLKTAGVQWLAATDGANFMIGSDSGITINAGAATHFGLIAPPTATAGVAFYVTVMALDAYGNAATFYSGTVAITTTDPQATVPSPYTYDDSFTFSLILLTRGTQTIKAADLGLPSIEGLWTINVN
jgi:hypothetical protein